LTHCRHLGTPGTRILTGKKAHVPKASCCKGAAAEQRFRGDEGWNSPHQLARKAHPQLRWLLGLQIRT